MMKIETYDNVDWHIHDVPKNIPKELHFECAGLHIALLMKWCIINELYDKQETHNLPFIDYLKANKITATQFLQEMDGKFLSDLLNEQGNSFISLYKDKSDDYLDDWLDMSEKDNYTILEKEINFSDFAHIVNKRYSDFQTLGKKANESTQPVKNESVLQKIMNMFK